MKFKIGDKVVSKKTLDCEIVDCEEMETKRVIIREGMTGKVIDIVGKLVGVEFDYFINGHCCREKGKSGYCYYCNQDMIENI